MADKAAKALEHIRRHGPTEPGVPDLIFPWTPGGQPGAIELKTGRGRLSDDQKAWRGVLVASGWRWDLARSVDDAVRVLRGWGFVIRLTPGGPINP